MHTIFAGIHIQNKPNELLPLRNIDFDKNTDYLKQLIAEQIEYDVQELELIYNGKVLADDIQLSKFMKPHSTVHCFRKTKPPPKYVPPTDIDTKRIQELFSLTAHIQISVNSRMNVLQKILTEYPEFHRNLGAQALIRDSVLFNTLHEPEVVQKLAKHYPIICDAAPFIVDTIRKELARNSSATNFTEQATSESTTSSEEEVSLGASGSSSSETNRSTSSTNARGGEMANIREISRQQLANALAQVGMGSFNSLSNIAQRNSETNSTDAPATSNTAAATAATNTNAARTGDAANNAAQDRITSEVFRQQLLRAFDSLNRDNERMDTTESATSSTHATNPLDAMVQDANNGDNADILPANYQQHQYAEQMRTMAQMGFYNHAVNLNYLELADGNIENAINLLMLGMN